MRISFLIHNVYGVGGTNRAVINLAGELARRHDVEIVSVFRRLPAPMLHIPDRVHVRGLLDLRPGQADRLDPRQRQRSAIVPGEEEFYATYSRLTDERLREYFTASQRDVYVGTRPAINLALAHWGPEDALLIAQEHQTHASIPAGLRSTMQSSYHRLAAAVTVTEADAVAFRAMTPVPGLHVTAVPNSSPAYPLPPATTAGPVLLAAGRLDAVKQYDVLVHAFRAVVGAHPDASLRIYGDGPERGRLRALIGDLALADRVLLMGRRPDLSTEWVKGAMLVSSSERESFGMSIIEAMRAGLPVVSTRAPVGPAEIIADGEDGLLVPVGDPAALAAAICALLQDPERRRAMGERARQNSARFDPLAVAQQYESVFRHLGDDRAGARYARRARTSAAVAARWVAAKVQRPVQEGPGDQAELARPLVDATLTADHALRFTVPATAEWDSVVLVKRRSDETVEVRLSGGPPTGAGRPAAPGCRTGVLAGSLLSEGRWDVHLQPKGGERIRAGAGPCDTRQALVSPMPQDGQGFSRVLPYETADAYLAVRAWSRPHHAELDSVEQVGSELLLSGRLVSQGGELTGGDVRVVAVSRLVDGPEWSSPAGAVHDGRFDVRVDLDRLSSHRVTRHDDWDLHVEAPLTGVRARLGRLADDIVDRKPLMAYEPTRTHTPEDLAMHEETPRSVVAVRPYFTVTNDFSLYVTED